MGASSTPHPLMISVMKESFGASIKRRRAAPQTQRSWRRRSGVHIRRIRPMPRSHVTTDKVDRRVRTLRKLIPSCNRSTEPPVGLDGLFRDTADYIMSLQTKVRAMQLLVNALTPTS